MEFVYQHLSREAVEEIKRVYDKQDWRIEFEAFAECMPIPQKN